MLPLLAIGLFSEQFGRSLQKVTLSRSVGLSEKFFLLGRPVGLQLVSVRVESG